MNRKPPKKSKKGVLNGPLFAASVVITLGGWVALASGDEVEIPPALALGVSDSWTVEGVAGPVELPAIPTIVPSRELFGVRTGIAQPAFGSDLANITRVVVPAAPRRPLIRTRSSR
jgi:hypothetical protein